MTESPRHLIKLLPDKKAFFCASDQRVLDAGLEAGLTLPHSCRGGNCGRCVARIVTGDYEYDRTTPPPGITAGQREAGQALLCQIVPRGPLTVETAQGTVAGLVPKVRLPCRIVQREEVAPDVMKLTLQLPRTQPMDFRPGQHLDVLLDGGKRRSYSLAGLPYSMTGASAPGEPARVATHLELHVRRVSGGLFSSLAFDQDRHVSLLRIEGPFGAFGWQEHDGPALMIAGGTGYAPVKSMLLAAMAQGHAQPVHLFWGGRDVRDLYELDALREWQKQYSWFSFTPVIENGDPDASHNDTTSSVEVGRVDRVALGQYEHLAEAMIYVSGPPGLVQSVADACRKRGVEEERLVTDSFDYAT